MRLRSILSLLVVAIIFSISLFAFNSAAAAQERDDVTRAIKQKKARWTASDTSISRLQIEKRKKRLGSFTPGITGAEKILAVTLAPVPTQLDWRDYNGKSYVTPVKEQGDCSDCWAFASVGALESNKLISNNTPGVSIDFSEQTLNSCSGAGSCSGGYIDAAANYIRDFGLPQESCYPYTGADGFCTGACSEWLNSAYRIPGWYKVAPTVSAIKYALYNYGPLVTLMAAHTDLFYYKSGIYENTYGSLEGYHATLIIGYNDAEQYFIVKSSWGEDWGEAGYARIAYSEVESNTQFGLWTIAYTTAIPADFPTVGNIPRDPNNPNNMNPGEQDKTQLSVLSGLIKDASGNVVSGAEVIVGKYRAVSGPAGQYVFSALPAGNYIATIKKNGYTIVSENMAIAPSATVTKDFVVAASSGSGDGKDSGKGDDATQDNKDNSASSYSGSMNDPGWFVVKGNPVTHAEADAFYKEKKKKLLAEAAGRAQIAGLATDISSEITELAYSLRKDPKLIYDYVHNHIDYVPYFNSHKGATLTYLDGSGNDFDQASLMIALLRASGYTANYVYGTMTIPGSDLANWLGVDQDVQTIGNVIASGGIPVTMNTNGTGIVDRVWVAATIDSITYHFDPAFKSYTDVSKIDIGTANGYSRSAFLATAASDATVTSDYTQNLNDVNLRSQLGTYATSLMNTIKSQYANYDMKQIIGGRSIVPTNLTAYQPPASMHFSPAVSETWTDIPDTHLTTVQILHEGINYTLNTHDLSGKRLTLTYNTATQPELRLDGTLLVKGNTTKTGNTYALTMNILHNYVGGYCNQTNVMYSPESGRTYAIAYNFGGISDKLLRKRQQQLDVYMSQGLPETTEAVRGETLNIMGQTWMKEVAMADRLLSNLGDTVNVMQHNIGFMAQEAGYYIDVKAAVGNVTSKHNTEADRLAVIKATSLISSALEHGILAQSMGTSGASTMSLFQIANNTGRKVFQATSANWAAIKQELQTQNPRTYTDASLTNFETMINNSKTLILPDNGLLYATGWSWHGMGYIAKDFSTNAISMAMIIGGGYYGGYSPNPETVNPDLIKKLSDLLGISIENAYKLWDSIKSTFGDPVDAASGTFLYSNTDLALGGAAPLGLSFSRSYASGDNLGKKTMGYGFTHNYDITLKAASHGDPGFGGRQPVDAASMIAALYVELDLLKSLDTIEAWMDASLTSKWAIDQVIDNVVNFNIGGKMLEYVKLPDNTYAPPPGVNTQLVKNGDNTYSLQERFGKRMNFNTDNKLYQIIDVDGNTMTFTYTGGNLTEVKDAYNRTLTLNYNSGNITSVTDSSTPARTVSYSYDADNNSTGYTDAENHPWTYVYATPANHRITGLRNPLNITTISNDYDSLGRVKSQTAPRQSGGTATYNYYFSGYRNQEVDYQGNATTYYFDEKGRQYAKEDALGHKETKTFDGQNHVVSVTGPRSTTSYPVVTTLDYDGNNNVKKVTNPLTYYITNTYDTQNHLTDTKNFNGSYDYKIHFDYDTEHHLVNTTVKTTSTASYSGGSGYYDNGLRQAATDGRGTATTFTYDAYGNPQTSKTGSHPQVNYVYDTIGRMTDLYDQENPSKSTHFVYDKRGLLQSKKDMLGKETTYTYYGNGLLHTRQDRKQQTTTYAYTPSDKMETITYPDTTQNVNFTYNNLDQLTEMLDSIGRSDNNRKATYSYDAVGRLTSMTDSNGFTIGYAYDAAGNLTTLTYPGNKVVSYTYDKLNRIKNVTINWLSNQTATYADYDAAGRLPGYTNFNGTVTAYGYDNANRLKTISNKKSDNSTVISDYTFTLDANGNRTETVQNEPYPHALNEGAVTYGYNDKKNRLNSAGAKTFTYDDEGQLAGQLEAGNGVAYTFDYEHRLQTIGDTSNQFFYDGMGNRSKAIRNGVTTKYIYDVAGRLLAEADGSGNITRYYIYGNGLLAAVTPANSVYCYHFSGVGSTVAMTDSTQAVVNKYAYDPFGNVASQSETVMTAQPFKYVGQYGVMTEPNGFYYMKARYYDPTVGRFISEDPIGFGGGDVNLMAYVGNNPVTGVDPSGFCKQSKSTTETSIVKGLTFGVLAALVVVKESLIISGIDAAQSLFMAALPGHVILTEAFDKSYQTQQAMENINTGYADQAKSISNQIQNIKEMVDSW